MLDVLIESDSSDKEFNYCHLVDAEASKLSTTFNVNVPKLMPFIPIGEPEVTQYVVKDIFVNDIKIPDVPLKNYITVPVLEPIMSEEEYQRTQVRNTNTLAVAQGQINTLHALVVELQEAINETRQGIQYKTSTLADIDVTQYDGGDPIGIFTAKPKAPIYYRGQRFVCIDIDGLHRDIKIVGVG